MGKELQQAGVDARKFIAGTSMDALLQWATPDTQLHGSGNLIEARELMRGGVPHVVVGNHLSNADAPVIQKAFKEYRVADPVFLVGMRLNEQWFTRFMAGGVNGIPVWPESKEPKNEREDAFRSKVNRNAAEVSLRVLGAGHPLVVFPEGTRSRSGMMELAKPKTARYLLMHPETRVLPVGLWNTEVVFPTDKKLPQRGSCAHISIGRGVAVHDLKDGIDMVSPSGQKELMDRTMKLVASLVPEDYRGVYS